VDGNKRTATIAFLEFLYLYSLEIDIEDTEKRQPLASLMERLAAGEIGHREFAGTLRPFVIASPD
jgi:prophage maintenance system killer protein